MYDTTSFETVSKATVRNLLCGIALSLLATVSALAQSAPETIQYGYDAQGRLSTVTNADGSIHTYLYENTSFPNALTGVMDESNSRYSTWTYDTQGRATETHEAGGAGATSLVYNSDDSVTVTDALGAVRTFTFTRVGDRNVTAGISGSQCPTCREGKATTYNNFGWVTSRTDYNNNVTTYVNDDARGLEISRTEASGTARARTITTQWHATYRLPTLISLYAGGSATGTPVLTMSFTYDTSGNLFTRTITDPVTTTSRTWTYSYNNFGQVLTVDGPRTDVSDITTLTYYTCTTGSECGQVQTVTDALGHVTTFNTYNAAGQPLTVTDQNNVVTTLAYDARQRLISRTVGTEQIVFEYYPIDLLKKVTLPDGSFLAYSYDSAHRLTTIADAAGNSIVYTLDALGNRVAENLYDPTSTLARTHSQVFNSLSQLYKDVNAQNTAAVTTTFGYDANGNQTSLNAPLGRNSANVFDELNRLTQVTDPANGITQFSYDSNDNLTQVTDPKSLSTTYTYNNLGDLTQQQSPDTGNTANTFDSAGNLKTSTDARNQVVTYSYDALNRVTQASYSDQTINFAYDTGTNASGRLTQVTDGSGSTSVTYTALGRIASKSAVIGSQTKAVNYGYNSAGQLTTMTTPSGQTIALAYTNNRVSSLMVNGTMVLSSVTYSPFGPATGWTWGNGTTRSRAFDLDGYLTSNQSAGSSSYTYNPDGSIATRSDDSSVNLNLGTGLTTLTTASTSSQLTTTTGALARTYAYDLVGNITSDGARSFTYNGAGRMITATSGGITTTYFYNALGQRVKKSNSNATSYFVYDEAGHLLGEYDSTGALIQELVWLGDIPVATIRTDQTGGNVGVFYIHTDHLNGPTRITRPADNQVIWRWDHDPYGNGTPNEDPDGNALLLTFNLRFPGQYFDSETGLLYNGYRDLDTATGRYVESDPIGLRGGINTYAYVGGNPTRNYDSNGLECTSAGANTNCSYPWGGPTFLVPTPPGFPANLAPTGTWDLLYHRYHVKVPLNGANAKCVMKKLIDNPTPGTPKPATPNGTRNNAEVLGQDNFVTSYLTSDVSTGGEMVVNVTGADSLFPNGYAARTVSNGFAHTYGEGTSVKQAPIFWSTVGAFVDPNDLLWGEQMRKFVKECSCGQ